MFLSKFVTATTFGIFWGVIGALIAFAWIRFLLEPKKSAASVGMSRTRALRTLVIFSAGWYVIWVAVHAVIYFVGGP